jgi:hypothetical protein
LRHEKSAAVILKDFWAGSVHDITIFILRMNTNGLILEVSEYMWIEVFKA